MFTDWMITEVLIFANIVLEAEAFHWSTRQQESHFIISHLGSKQELPCDYTLTLEESQQSNKFFIVTWSQEVDLEGNSKTKRWIGLAARSVDSFLGTKDLIPDDNVFFSTINNSLFISNITKANSGKYQCELRSSFYTTPSTLHLDVHYPPEGTKLTIDKFTKNQTAVLKCSVTSSNPPAKYRFYHNQVLLGTHDLGVYQLGKLASLKSGVYKCFPYNSVGEGPASQLSYVASDKLPEVITKTTEKRAPAFIAASLLGVILMFLLALLSLVCCRRIKNNNKDRISVKLAVSE